jgi:hypothetical protein
MRNAAVPMAIFMGAMLIACGLWYFTQPHYQLVGEVGTGPVYRLNTRTGATDPCWRYLAPNSSTLGLVCGDTSAVPPGSMIGR